MASSSFSGKSPKQIRLLILPKFDYGELGNGVYGEGELFYREYLRGGEEYVFPGLYPGEKLYYKDGIALTMPHCGKTNTAVALTSILCNPEFDCRGMRTLSVGCAGSSYEDTVMGDVFIASAIIDMESGNTVVDSNNRLTWFPMPDTEQYGCHILDTGRVESLYSLTKDIALDTTPRTQAFMAAYSPALSRRPRVMKATFATSDNYWKGREFHEIAEMKVRHYGCPDPYRVAEMEEIAVASTLKRFGLSDGYMGLRVSVNLDDYMNGATPETMFGNSFESNMTDENNLEGADIFDTAMHNLFRVGKTIIDFLPD